MCGHGTPGHLIPRLIRARLPHQRAGRGLPPSHAGRGQAPPQTKGSLSAASASSWLKDIFVIFDQLMS